MLTRTGDFIERWLMKFSGEYVLPISRVFTASRSHGVVDTNQIVVIVPVLTTQYLYHRHCDLLNS